MHACSVASVVPYSWGYGLLGLRTIAHQAPLFMGFSRQEYWTWMPCPPPGDLPNAGIEPMSLVSPALTSRFFTTEPPGKPQGKYSYDKISAET